MNNSRKTDIRRYFGGQAVLLGLALLALNVPVGAQQTPGAVLITFGQTVQGTLTSTDPVFEDGTPYDTYYFTVTAPGQRFFITATSPAIPLYSALYYVPQTGPATGQQDASTFRGGQTLGYYGVLNQPGRYEIDVNADSPQQPTGSYTLSLTNVPPPAGASPAGPPPAAPPPAGPPPAGPPPAGLYPRLR